MGVVLTSNLQRLIKKPEINQSVGENAVAKISSMCKQLGYGSYESANGYGYIPFADTKMVAAANFDKFSFVLTNSNFNDSLGTSAGTLTDNLQRNELQIFQNWVFELPDETADTSIDFFVNTYRLGTLESKQADEMISKIFANQKLAGEMLYLNRFLLGTDKLTTHLDGTTTTTHYSGLKDLYNFAAAESAVSSIDNIDVLGTTPVHHIDLSLNSESTAEEQMSEILNLPFKLSQMNTVFSYKTSAGSLYLNEGSNPEDIIIICKSSFEKKNIMKDYSYYKTWNKLKEAGSIVVLQEASLNVEFYNRTSTELGDAIPFNLLSQIQIADDELLFIDRTKWIQYEYKLSNEEANDITPNNITHKLTSVVGLCKVCDYKPNGIVVLVKAPAIIDLSSSVLPQ